MIRPQAAAASEPSSVPYKEKETRNLHSFGHSLRISGERVGRKTHKHKKGVGLIQSNPLIFLVLPMRFERMLRFLNDHAGDRALDETALAALALTLGADVPFFLLGRPARATGVGERLVPDDPGLAGFFVVVVCPRTRIATAWAYAALDASRDLPPKPGENCLTSVFEKNRRAFCVTGQPLRNDFESVVFAASPEIGRIKERLLACGAAAALLSGSGSAVFGLFRERHMNLSGRAARAACDFYKVDPADVLVIHDELDLPLGRMRIKRGGGNAGHNGLKSLTQELGTPDFFRLRLGIGRPAPGRDVAGYVLEPFPSQEMATVRRVLPAAVAAVLELFEDGLDAVRQRLGTFDGTA